MGDRETINVRVEWASASSSDLCSYVHGQKRSKYPPSLCDYAFLPRPPLLRECQASFRSLPSNELNRVFNIKDIRSLADRSCDCYDANNELLSCRTREDTYILLTWPRLFHGVSDR